MPTTIFSHTPKTEHTDLPTRLGPDSSTIPIPSHSAMIPSRPSNSHPTFSFPFPFPFPASYAVNPSLVDGAVRLTHSSIRSSRSSFGMVGRRERRVGRGVYIRFSVVLIPADSGY
jgi:hypothetical protein